MKNNLKNSKLMLVVTLLSASGAFASGKNLIVSGASKTGLTKKVTEKCKNAALSVVQTMKNNPGKIAVIAGAVAFVDPTFTAGVVAGRAGYGFVTHAAMQTFHPNNLTVRHQPIISWMTMPEKTLIAADSEVNCPVNMTHSQFGVEFVKIGSKVIGGIGAIVSLANTCPVPNLFIEGALCGYADVGGCLWLHDFYQTRKKAQQQLRETIHTPETTADLAALQDDLDAALDEKTVPALPPFDQSLKNKTLEITSDDKK